jgi:hypothetical protein
MVEVPVPMPVIAPVDVFIVATPVLLLAHVPPVVVLANVDVVPTHDVSEPVIAAGSGLTVTSAVL